MWAAAVWASLGTAQWHKLWNDGVLFYFFSFFSLFSLVVFYFLSSFTLFHCIFYVFLCYVLFWSLFFRDIISVFSSFFLFLLGL